MRKIPVPCVAFRYISKRCEIVASAFPARLPGTRRRSWTSPRCSLCSRGNIARFRRRWYEMAETACVTEAQRLGYVEATHVFCDDPGLLVWEETGLYPEETGLKSCFFLTKKKKTSGLCLQQAANGDCGSTLLELTGEGELDIWIFFLLTRRVCRVIVNCLEGEWVQTNVCPARYCEYVLTLLQCTRWPPQQASTGLA